MFRSVASTSTKAARLHISTKNAVRTAAVTNVRFIQSKTFIDKHIKEKYRAQLEARAKQKGLESSQKLLEEMKETIEETKKQMNMVDPLKELEDYQQAMMLKDSMQGKKKKVVDLEGRKLDPITGKVEKPYKTLDSYLVLDKIKDLGAKEIEFLWRAKFQKDEQSIVAIAPFETFMKMYVNARKYPTFVLPLPRADAIVDGEPSEKTPMEMHFVQWSFVGPETTHCMITTLMEYKLHGEYARPHTTLSFHQDIGAEKGIVLMDGRIDEQSSVSPEDSRVLLFNVQRFYGALSTGSEVEQQRLALLRKFNTGDTSFSMDECISLSQSMEH